MIERLGAGRVTQEQETEPALARADATSGPVDRAEAAPELPTWASTPVVADRWYDDWTVPRERVVASIAGRTSYSPEQVDSLIADLDRMPAEVRDATIAELYLQHDQQGLAEFLRQVAVRSPDKLGGYLASVKRVDAHAPSGKQHELVCEMMYLRGPGAAAAKTATLQAIGTDSERGRRLARSLEDPKWGIVYGGYHEHPRECAELLRGVAAEQPAQLKGYFRALGDIGMNVPMSSRDERFLQAIGGTTGPGAARLKGEAVLLVNREMEPYDASMHSGVRKDLQGHVSQTYYLLGQPEVTESLLHENRRGLQHALDHLFKYDTAAGKQVVTSFMEHKATLVGEHLKSTHAEREERATRQVHDMGILIAMSEKAYAWGHPSVELGGFRGEVLVAVAGGLGKLHGFVAEKAAELAAQWLRQPAMDASSMAAGMFALGSLLYDAVMDPRAEQQQHTSEEVRRIYSQQRDDFGIQMSSAYQAMTREKQVLR